MGVSKDIKSFAEGINSDLTSHFGSEGADSRLKLSFDKNSGKTTIESTEDDGRERREAKVYITPDLIGDNQPDFQDEVTLTYAGSTRVGQIVNIDTRQGGQTYLFTLLVRF